MQAQQKESRIVDAFIAEIDQEAPATRRLLEIVPDDKLEWRPHPKAMSLGQLAMHVAQTQGGVAEGTDADFISAPDFIHNEGKSRAEILNAFEEGTKKAKEILSTTSDEKARISSRVRSCNSQPFSIARNTNRPTSSCACRNGKPFRAR